MAATWAWAGNLAPRLGLFWLGATTAVDLHPTVEHPFWKIKTPAAAPPDTLAPTSSLPFSVFATPESRRSRTRERMRQGGGGAAVAPFAGAHVRPEPRATPSSDTAVVPFAPRAEYQRRRRAHGSAVLPAAGKMAAQLFFPRAVVSTVARKTRYVLVVL